MIACRVAERFRFRLCGRPRFGVNTSDYTR